MAGSSTRESGSSLVFKVATQTSWREACRAGSFAGSDDDRRDGFIHLSTLGQVAGTLARHFNGQRDLVLVAIDARRLGPALKWEPSRGGELFPHYYGLLPVAAVCAQYDLSLDALGVHVLPAEIRGC